MMRLSRSRAVAAAARSSVSTRSGSRVTAFFGTSGDAAGRRETRDVTSSSAHFQKPRIATVTLARVRGSRSAHRSITPRRSSIVTSSGSRCARRQGHTSEHALVVADRRAVDETTLVAAPAHVPADELTERGRTVDLSFTAYRRTRAASARVNRVAVAWELDPPMSAPGCSAVPGRLSRRSLRLQRDSHQLSGGACRGRSKRKLLIARSPRFRPPHEEMRVPPEVSFLGGGEARFVRVDDHAEVALVTDQWTAVLLRPAS